MEVVHELTMHLDDRRLVPCVDAVQGDANTRVLEMTLLSGGEAWDVPDGMAVSVAYRKGDGTAGWYDELPDGTAACSYSGNVVRAVLVPQVLTAWGKVQVAVVIQDPDTLDQIAVFPVCVEVARNPAAGQGISNDYYNYKTMAEINDAIDELWAAVGSGGGGSCGCSITVARTGSEDDPVDLSVYVIGAGDTVRFPAGTYYVEPLDLEGLDRVTFQLGDAEIRCVGGYFLSATGCDDLQILGGTISGGSDTVMGVQVKDCLRPVFRQVRFSGIGSETVEDTKGLFILGDCTGFLVERCVVEDITAGVVSSDGFIHAYGVFVNRKGSDNTHSLKGEIRHCTFDGIAGIDSDTVKADGDGIFVQRPPYLDDDGEVAGIDQVIEIDGCVFSNCKKRGVKSAAWGTVVRDCTFEGDFYYAPVDLQYGHGLVDRCRIVNSSNYTGSVTSGVVANDGGFTVRDTYINCLYVNEDGTNGRHPAVRMDKRQDGSIFDASVPWDPILVERCHFDEISYGVYASTSVSGVDTYRLTALEVLDCRWGAFYHGYGVYISPTVFADVDAVRFVDFRFDAGVTKVEVQAVNSSFQLPISVGAEPAQAYEISSRYWLDTALASDDKPTAAHTEIVSVGEGCRKVYTAYGSQIWGSGDPNGAVSGDAVYELLVDSKLGDVYTDTATGKKYVCTTTGGIGVWTEAGGVGIASVQQTATSSEDGGENVVTVTMTDGSTAQFSVLNGSKGSAGDSYELTDTDKLAIAEQVDDVTLVAAPPYAESVEKMDEEVSKTYVLASNGHIYAYLDRTTEQEVTVTDTIEATDDNPYHDQSRLSSSTTDDTFTTGSDQNGYHLTPLIDLTKTEYAGKTIQLHLEGAQYCSTGTYAQWIQCRLYGTDKAILSTRPYTCDAAPDASYVMYATNGISITYNSETSATITITVPPTYGSASLEVGYMRFCGKGAITDSNICITYTDTQSVSGWQWVDTGTTYAPTLTAAERQEIAEAAAALIDTQMLDIIGDGTVTV